MSLDNPTPLTRRELREQENRRTSRQVPVPQAPSWASTTTVVVRRPAAKPKKKLASSLLSFGAMLFAGALLVGVSVPANAFMSDAAPLAAATTAAIEGQTVAVSADALAADTTRASYTVTSYAELLRARYGNRTYSYTVGSGPVQWPFPYAVPISDGYGERVAPCRGCSSFHKGTDFTPGGGSAIYAIAAGTVTHAEVSDYGMGNNIIIDHVVNGVRVQSMYAHMQMSSSPLKVGDVVNVGDYVGLVGDTGTAIGAHLHLEILVNGVNVDPYNWLKTNAAK
jgi:murein DD-endopeptidase MepM/ murein hydrolase activator NlpD